MANLQNPHELTNYQRWQQEKFGNILPELSIDPDGECENTEEELHRAAHWNYLQEHSFYHEN